MCKAKNKLNKIDLEIRIKIMKYGSTRKDRFVTATTLARFKHENDSFKNQLKYNELF